MEFEIHCAGKIHGKFTSFLVSMICLSSDVHTHCPFRCFSCKYKTLCTKFGIRFVYCVICMYAMCMSCLVIRGCERRSHQILQSQFQIGTSKL